jgi:hypothetical protein
MPLWDPANAATTAVATDAAVNPGFVSDRYSLARATLTPSVE